MNEEVLERRHVKLKQNSENLIRTKNTRIYIRFK